jgi:hypothetical protein
VNRDSGTDSANGGWLPRLAAGDSRLRFSTICSTCFKRSIRSSAALILNPPPLIFNSAALVLHPTVLVFDLAALVLYLAALLLGIAAFMTASTNQDGHQSNHCNVFHNHVRSSLTL